MSLESFTLNLAHKIQYPFFFQAKFYINDTLQLETIDTNSLDN